VHARAESEQLKEEPLQNVDVRLASLERTNRWLTRAVVGLALCLLTIVAAAFKPKDGVVEAGKFILLDEKGHMRASLSVDSDGSTGFSFFDAKDSGRLSMGLGKEGEPRILLRAESASAPGGAYTALSSTRLTLLDATGKPRAGIGMSDAGTPSLYLGDSRGQRRAKLEMLDEGAAHLMFVDEKGTTTWEAPKQ
jgi:hypothetical protein